MPYAPEEINTLDILYFNKIKEIIERNGTTFIKNLTSHFQIADSWEDYDGKMSFIQEGVERVVQSIISNNVDWEVCSTPVGADSVFITSKAIIHIDSKAILFSDGDARDNKVTLSGNQTSYATENAIVYENIPFKSRLPTSYKHKTYGELVCLTYFVKVIYDMTEQLESFRKFRVILCSIPNGVLKHIYGDEIMVAGRGLDNPLFEKISHDEFNQMTESINDDERKLMNRLYLRDTLTNSYALQELNADDRKNLSSLFKDKNWNQCRKTIRVSFNEIPINIENPYFWDHSVELFLH